MAGMELPDNVLQIINAAVSVAIEKAVEQTRAQMPPTEPQPKIDYFRAMEKLLFSYPALKRIVFDKATYTSVHLTERSKSIVGFNYNATKKSRDDIIEEMESDRETEYNTTLKDFRRIERVVDAHRDRKEFIVVSMYYFNEDIDGNERGMEADKNSLLDISLALGRDEKTIRRWRSAIVKDMAICLFGIEAAIYIT